ncbi:hypothetical protein TELCIR_14296 [Teladorsagia circumcincta]|uniref:RNA-directed DNA polymerase n=1 Tax=Teladorsagia circumcincta TaxID=45464 RepID=A0A2G9U1G6_TELCI|nr:hypothetical protein TELCIR_14296 [Teladorsagia circumcincta]
MPQLRYLGNIIDATGRRPHPAKIEVIRKMPYPTDIGQVRSFLGMLNYYGHFISEMRQLRAQSDELLKKNVRFEWSAECRDAFQRAKDMLASDLLLTHYDPTKEILLTDHKPLLAILGSKNGVPIYTANTLQRWALIVKNYDFTIEYRSTSNFGQADALSRSSHYHNRKRLEHDIHQCNIEFTTQCEENSGRNIKSSPAECSEIRSERRMAKEIRDRNSIQMP